MFKEIESLYKKKSPYNIIKIRFFWIYVISVSLSLIFKVTNSIILMLLAFLIMIFCVIKMCEKVLNTKLYIRFNDKNDAKPLNSIIADAELNLFRKYTKENKIYNEKSLLCIIDHYRTNTRIKVAGGNLLTVISILVPVIMSFYTDTGFDFTGFSNALPYLIAFAIVIIILYLSLSQLFEIKKFLKGEDGMIERLEEIFSELYVECLNKPSIDKKKKTKKLRKLSK